MKAKKYLSLLLLVSLFSLPAGCSLQKTAQKLQEAENAVEQKLENAENAAKDALIPDALLPDTRIASAEAQTIALRHAGLSENQVTGLFAELDADDRILHYNVQFREGIWEYEYEIHAETGEVLAFEKDN